MRMTLVVSVCSLIVGCWAESLPSLPPETGGQVILEGVVRHGVDGQRGLLPWPGARIEVVGYGLVTAGGSDAESSDPAGWFRLQIPSLSSDRNIEFLVFDPDAPKDAPPAGRRVYNLLGGTKAQVSVDLDVGARGSLTGRVELVGEPHSGGVIVYAEGIPGADDLSGPDGSFFLHGIPEGDVRVGFIYEDYVVAPTTFIATKVDPYFVKVLDETVRLSPTAGEPSTAGVSGQVQLAEEMQASDLELVVSPLIGRNSEGLSAAEPVKVMELESDGSFAFALDFAEPHTLMLRSKADAQAMPIRSARLHHVRRGSSDLVMAARWATYDEDGDGYADGADTDGDGLSDAVDEDPDDDGCLDEPELTRLNPYSCGDFDGDGIADGIDPDLDGDGDSDLEELTMGADGKFSDLRNGQHSARQAFAAGEPSDCGRVIADGEGADVITYVDTDPIPALLALEDHQAYFGDRRLTPMYRVVVPDGGSVKLQAQFAGIQSTADRFRIVVLSDCGEACGQAFELRDLSGAMVDCVASGRGRKTCPAEPFEQTLTQTSLVWLHRYGPKLALQNCGDGVVNSGEECDDGNLIQTDDCLTTCRRARCGDSIIQAGVEACDDGNRRLTDACAVDCQLARCGDGQRRSDLAEGDPGYEACDDGNEEATDACLQDCTVARCGDGHVQTGVEACDDGNADLTDACLNDCTLASCGDSHVQVDVEACDDGNEADDDACRNTCVLALCGDGVRRQDLTPDDDGFEACDDGNQNRTDACLNDCSLARCGDRFVQNGVEACDDGNDNQTDRCLNDCTLATCGDGHVELEQDQCDDGNQVDNDVCRNDCTFARCGDGVRRVDLNPDDDGFEACDDGNQVQTDACLNDCSAARCGDQFVHNGVEACDDGNANEDDSCLNNCLAAACGDGIRRVDILTPDDPNYEACDDGNQIQTDDCLTNCTVARCGDGHTRVGLEDCDDGNVDAFDGCTNDCRSVQEPDGCSFVRTRFRVTVFCSGNTMEMPADLAEFFCIEWGGQLVTIDDDIDNDILRTAAGGERVWIGLRRAGGNLSWLGRSSEYTNWAAGEPNNQGGEDCVEMYDVGTWNDLDCSSAKSYFCELSDP